MASHCIVHTGLDSQQFSYLSLLGVGLQAGAAVSSMDHYFIKIRMHYSCELS